MWEDREYDEGTIGLRNIAFIPEPFFVISNFFYAIDIDTSALSVFIDHQFVMLLCIYEAEVVATSSPKKPKLRETVRHYIQTLPLAYELGLEI